MGRSGHRRRNLVVGFVALGLLSFLVVVATPIVQTQLIVWAFSSLERRYGIVGHADVLDIDLASLDIRFEGLTLATRERADEPFFTVDEARIDLPWSAIWDELSVQAVTLVSPRLLVRTDARGSSNLPSTGADTDTVAASIVRLPIGGLSVRDLTAGWRDETRDLTIEVGRTDIELAGDRSRVSGPMVGDDIVAELNEEQVRVTELQGQLSFDGETLTLDSLTAATPEVALDASGQIATVLSTPTLDLSLESSVSLERLAPRFAVFGDAVVDGDVALSGTVTGPAGDPTAALSASSEAVSWNEVEAQELSSRVELTSRSARLEDLSMLVSGGAVSATGTIAFTDELSNSLDLAWDAVDADAVAADLEWARPFILGMPMSGTLDADWTALDPRSATVSLVNRSGGPGQTGETRLESDNGRYRLTVDQQFAGAARLTGSLEGQAVSSVWSEIEVEGAFEVECDELEICRSRVLDRPSEGALADALNELGGNVEAMLRLSGSLQSPRLSGPAVAALTGVSGLPPIDLTLDLSGDRAGLEVAGVTGGFGQNSVTGGARIVWENGALSGRFNGEVHPEDFAPLVPDGWVPPAGTVQFEALLEGTLDSPQLFTDATGNVVLQPMFAGTEDEIPIGGTMAVDISGEVFREPHLAGVQHIDDFVWGDTRLGDGILDVLIDPSTASFGIELFELGARGSVDLTLTDERLFRGEFNVTSDGETTNLARLGEALGLPLSGELFLEGVAVGSLDSLAEMTAEVELMLRNGRFGDHLLALRPLSAVLHYAPTGISIDDVALHLGESVLSVSGGLTPDGTGTLTAQANAAGEGILGVMASIPGSERWLPELEMTGTIRMDTVTTGWINAPVIEGRLEVESDQIGLGDHPPFEQVDLRLSFREGIADVEAISAKWQDSAITGSGSFPISLWADRLPAAFVETLPPDGRATLSLRVDSLTTDALAGYVDDATIGELDGVATATLELETERPTLEALRGTLMLEDAELTAAGIPLVQRRPTSLEITGGQLRVTSFDWGNTDDYLTLGGSIDLLGEPSADLTVTAEMDLRTLSPFTTTAVTEGDALLIANVQGPLSAPEITGTMEVMGGGIRVADPPLIVSGLNGAVLFTRERVQFHELIGEVNGGPLEVRGELELLGLRPQGELTLVGRSLAMEIPEGLRTEVDADLTLSLSDDQSSLGGTLTLLRGAYRETLTLTGGLLAALQEQESVTILGMEEESPLDAIELNVRVVTDEDIIVDNNYADAAVGFDLRVVGTAGSPALTGRAALAEGGRIRLGNRVYEVDTGAADFVDPTGIEPELDITARTRVSGHDITVDIAGGPDSLTTSFQSDPAESESDIVSLLLTGRTLGSGLRVSDARARVDQDYRQAGFNQVRVSIRSTVDQVSDTVAVALEVEEGPRQVVQEIEVTGGDRTHSGLVSRALQLSPGQAVDLGEWNRVRKRLYDTGAFRSVDIEAEPLDGVIEPVPGEQPVRARVRLEEWPAYRLRYGLQLKDEEVPLGEQSEQTLNAGFVGDLTRQNFAGRAVTLGTAFRWDTDQRVVRGFGRIPSFFGLPITLSLFVAQEHETSVETFDDIDFFTVADVTGLTLEQRVRPRPALTFAYSYSLERNHSFDPNARSNDPFAFDIIRRIARLAGTVIIDTRDDVFDASRGWFHSSSLEYAPESLGSQFRFTKYSVQQFHYWPIGREIVVATAARAALAQAFGQDLDLRERFFAGDGNTVRGYRQDSLGPLFRGQPDGGNALVVLNQEVRFPIFGITRGVGFVDAGNVFPLLENFDITDLKVGAGIGLRLATPFGLFRFDFATPLSKIEDERRSRFFFSIGQIF